MTTMLCMMAMVQHHPHRDSLPLQQHFKQASFITTGVAKPTLLAMPEQMTHANSVISSISSLVNQPVLYCG